MSPNISTDARVRALPCPLARLLFTWMITHADNKGRLRGEPGLLRMLVIPYERAKDVEVALWLRKMAELGLLDWYTVGGGHYVQLSGWDNHQKLTRIGQNSDLPGPDHALSEPVHGLTRHVAEVEVEVEVNRKRSEEEGEGVERTSTPPVALLPAICGNFYPVSQEQASEWQSAYPAVEVRGQLLEMVAWLKANPSNRKTLSGMPRFVVRWLGREQDKAPRVVGAVSDAESNSNIAAIRAMVEAKTRSSNGKPTA